MLQRSDGSGPALNAVPCRERKSYQEQVETLNKQVSEDKQQRDGLKSRVGDLEKRLRDAGLYLGAGLTRQPYSLGKAL